MHCTSQSLLRGAFSAALRQPATTPPSFLLPAALLQQQQATPFSTTASLHKKRSSARRDNNPARGTSALRHTGLNKKQGISVSLADLPKPVLDPSRRSTVDVDPNHGLWGFFTEDKEVMQPPLAVSAHGRAWTVAELRVRDWDDLHRLWWVCVKEINRIKTMEAERERVKAGYGEYEAQERMQVVRKTMQRIKFTLTERWYAWEDARWDAMADPAVDMYAEDGKSAYDESKDVGQSEDAFEKAEIASDAESNAERGTYIPPGLATPNRESEARV